MTATQIKGNWATLLLPIDDSDRVDFARLAAELDYLVQAGVDGIYSNGTAGEFYNQTAAEFLQISTMLAERCHAHQVPFQIGVNHTSPVVTLERVGQVKPLAPSAMQIILPDWFPLSMPEAVDYLQRIGEAAAPIGLVLYNPSHAKRRLSPRELDQLADTVPALVGVKVADGDDTWYAAMRPVLSKLSVFVPGHHVATGIAQGAAGAYSNVACLSPRGAQRWTDLVSSDPAAALEIEQRVRTFMSEHIQPLIADQGYSNQAVDKCLAAVGQWAPIEARLRWPYRWVSPETVTALRPIARTALPEFFE